MEAGSAGVTVVTGETGFADTGSSPGIRPAGVVHCTCCTALTVWRENETLVCLIISESSWLQLFPTMRTSLSSASHVYRPQWRKHTGWYDEISKWLCRRDWQASVLSHSNEFHIFSPKIQTWTKIIILLYHFKKIYKPTNTSPVARIKVNPRCV